MGMLTRRMPGAGLFRETSLVAESFFHTRRISGPHDWLRAFLLVKFLRLLNADQFIS